jgi:hypothetical protein
LGPLTDNYRVDKPGIDEKPMAVHTLKQNANKKGDKNSKFFKERQTANESEFRKGVNVGK